QSGDTDANFYVGAGAKYALSDFVHLRLDGRLLAAPNTGDNTFSTDWELTAGVGITLGGHPKETPPPPPPLVKDTDGDGIPDTEDNCPRRPVRARTRGARTRTPTRTASSIVWTS